ncbi:Transferrin receptor-like, PAG-like [Trypanosoma congolense IL3000]|uniref:Transferrin receptor-like, PAG-like n=1 Tax=Trypanosoma congolense (strain IL3000) TaxID=1068625 RepID=F9W5S8_TRYCI|nr:Transferrin receptor-like, PAG-like [Trypanosoma congolense IL3000]
MKSARNLCAIALLLFLAQTAVADYSALRLEAAKGACAVSRKLKSMYKYVKIKRKEASDILQNVDNVVKLARLRVMKEHHEHLECDKMRVFVSFVNGVRTGIRQATRRLYTAGVKVVASAGLAAGRLDEFVNIFREASHFEDFFERRDVKRHVYRFCIRGDGAEYAEKRNIGDCFMNKGESETDEFLPVDGGDVVGKSDAEIEDVIKTYLRLVDGDPRDDKGENRSCMLTVVRPSEGYLGTGQTDGNIIWGDGLLGIAKQGNGSTGSTGSTRDKSYKTNIVWEGNPTETVPTLKAFLKNYNDFNRKMAQIGLLSRKLTEEWTIEYLDRNKRDFMCAVVQSGAFKKMSSEVSAALMTDDTEYDDEDAGGGSGNEVLDNFIYMNDRKQEWLAHWDKDKIERDVLTGEFGMCRSTAGMWRNHTNRSWLFHIPFLRR